MAPVSRRQPGAWAAIILLSLLVFLLLFSVSASGCAYTNMETARQLDAGEYVASATIDLPGYSFIPRVSGQGIHGLGAGDVSASFGSALLINHLGLGARLYPTDWLILSLQGDLSWHLDSIIDDPAWVVLTPRIYSAVREGGLLYGGVQSNLFVFHSFEGDGQWGNGNVGVFIGGDWLNPKTGVGIQAELIVNPVHFDLTDGSVASVFLGNGDGIHSLVEFAVGMYWRYPSGDLSQPPMTATEEEREAEGGGDEELGRGELGGDERRGEVPDLGHDEQGVPLY